LQRKVIMSEETNEHLDRLVHSVVTSGVPNELGRLREICDYLDSLGELKSFETLQDYYDSPPDDETETIIFAPLSEHLFKLKEYVLAFETLLEHSLKPKARKALEAGHAHIEANFDALSASHELSDDEIVRVGERFSPDTTLLDIPRIAVETAVSEKAVCGLFIRLVDFDETINVRV